MDNMHHCLRVTTQQAAQNIQLQPGMVEIDGTRTASVKKTFDKRLMKRPAKRKSVIQKKPCMKVMKKSLPLLCTQALVIFCCWHPKSHQRWNTCAAGEPSGSDAILVAKVERQEACYRE